MAGTVNKVMLLGRLTRDPEIRTFNNGGKLANFGFVVDGGGKKDSATGKWEPEPCFLDIKAFNSERGQKLADVVESYLKKGSQAFIEGHLVFEQWTAKEGGKRTAIRIVADRITLVGSKSDAPARTPTSPSEPTPEASLDPFGDTGTGPLPPDDVPF